MDAKTIIAIVLVVFIVGAAVWLNIRNRSRRKTTGVCLYNEWLRSSCH